MLIFICIQLIFYCSAQTSQCKATSVSWSIDEFFLVNWNLDGKLPYLVLDVCNSGITDGSFISQKFECDSQGDLYEKRWFGSDCLGDPYYEEILDDVFEPTLIGPSGTSKYVELDYARNLNKSECSKSKNCDYAIVKVYEDCGDDYLEQAWVMNECVSTSDGTYSCAFGCETSSRSIPSIWLHCYEGDNCMHNISSENHIWKQIVEEKECIINDINNISYRYEIGCDAYIAPSTTTANITMSTNTNIDEESYHSEESRWNDMWMIIAIVFIILFIIVVIGVVFSYLVQRRNIQKVGYTKTDVADTDQV